MILLQGIVVLRHRYRNEPLTLPCFVIKKPVGGLIVAALHCTVQLLGDIYPTDGPLFLTEISPPKQAVG